MDNDYYNKKIKLRDSKEYHLEEEYEDDKCETKSYNERNKNCLIKKMIQNENYGAKDNNLHYFKRSMQQNDLNYQGFEAKRGVINGKIDEFSLKAQSLKAINYFNEKTKTFRSSICKKYGFDAISSYEREYWKRPNYHDNIYGQKNIYLKNKDSHIKYIEQQCVFNFNEISKESLLGLLNRLMKIDSFFKNKSNFLPNFDFLLQQYDIFFQRKKKTKGGILGINEKRRNHVNSEHRRKDAISIGINALGDILPNQDFFEDDADIVFEAVFYILKLRYKNILLRNNIKE
ncbi:hypothetical protein CWI36_0970p0010 [Hamiltosporidium magnivora]|uniref:BHLH domain-containing protein n=1 Tax=Hamiltosporidium magnivora TaxID=148818 RepID=A0A4Q9L799_9MICR|nr:hypothetical protein CWI36_0970p0010 [Hamiltosporidium magnivora]